MQVHVLLSVHDVACGNVVLLQKEEGKAGIIEPEGAMQAKNQFKKKNTFNTILGEIKL